ncbi:MAG: methionyl-tRNA formyltransferase [Kofleriaceae bacterium]
MVPAGRGGKIEPTPVAAWASAHGLPLVQPRAVRTPAFAEELAALGADVAVVVAYGRILPPAVLAAFPLGCVNVHGSRLPRYRGAAPIQRAVIAGDATTGVSIMRLDEGMDTGPVFATTEVAIGADETSGELMARLAEVGAAALVPVLDALAAGTAHAAPQPAEDASHAAMLTKADAVIDFAGPAAAAAARIRGVDPWPGAIARRGDVVLKLFGARARARRPEEAAATPGTVLAIDDAGAHVAAGEGVVIVRELQAPGRKRLRAAQVAAGRGLAVGDVLATAGVA